MGETNSGQKVLIGVDELTAVLISSTVYAGGLAGWEKKAEAMIGEFARLANLEGIFGKQKELEGPPPQGYTAAYQYGDQPFYFAVAYHPSHPKMGVIVKFSAYSWAVYCQKGETDIKRFLQSVSSDLYGVRLSRVDFTADYQDWDMSVDDIYQKLKGKQLIIHNHKGEINHSEINAQETDGKASTFYVGSRKAGTRLFLRVYDKKKEQLEKKGFRYKEALNTKSWVRFEAVFKGDYAHQLTNIIKHGEETLFKGFSTNAIKHGEEKPEGSAEKEKLEGSAEKEKLEALIANKITEKYRFYDTESNEYTDFTKALCETSKGDFPRLRMESPRDNELLDSLLHLVNGSGLFPALYKCDEIWGNESSIGLLKCLHDIYRDDYAPNDDVRLWLKNNKEVLAGQSLNDDLELLRLSSAKRKPETTAKAEHKTALPPAGDWEELFLQAGRDQKQSEAQRKKYWEAEAERNRQQKEQWEKYLEARANAKKSPE